MVLFGDSVNNNDDPIVRSGHLEPSGKPYFECLYTFIIVFTMLFAGCLKEQGDELYPYMNSYYISIKANETTEYNVYVPSIVTADGNLSQLMNDFIFITGNGTQNIIDTKFGQVLNITAMGEIRLRSSNSKIYPNGYHLDNFPYHPDDNYNSLNNISKDYRNGPIGEVWVFSNISNNDTLVMRLVLDINSHQHKVNAEVIQGWQAVSVRFETNDD